MSSSVPAATWHWSGQSQLGSYYDDNVSMVVVEPIESWSSTLNLSASILLVDDAFTWQTVPRVNVVRYAGANANKAYDREDQSISSTLQWRSERATTRIALEGLQDTTLTSELGLTGFTQVNKLHRSGTATVAQTWQATELASVNIQLAHNMSRYVDAGLTGLVNYDYSSAAAGWQQAVSALSGVFVNLSAGQLRVSDLDGYDKLNLQASLGYRRRVGQHGQLEVSLGPSSVRNDVRTDHGLIYSAEYRYSAEQSTFSVAASRSTTPTGRGWLSVRDQLVLSSYYPWSERWFSSISLDLSRNHYALPDYGLNTDDLEYADTHLGIGWHITPNLDISLSAGYALQRLAGTEDSADRRHAALNLSWRGLNQSLN